MNVTGCNQDAWTVAELLELDLIRPGLADFASVEEHRNPGQPVACVSPSFNVSRVCGKLF